MESTVSTPRKYRLLTIVAVTLLAWFALAEVVSHAWYFVHESKFKRNPIPATGEELVGRIHRFAEDGGGFGISEQSIPSAAMEMLNCGYGRTLSWSNMGSVSAVTILRWLDRSSSGGVESSHNPGTCLKAAGWTVGKSTLLGIEDYCGVTAEVTEWEVERPGIKMLAYSAVFRRFAGAPSIKRILSRNDERWGAVFAGRRDAPVLVVLAYLSADPSDSLAPRERFRQIMKAGFCTSKSTAE